MAGGHGHTFGGLTVHAPKRWQVLTGQGMCAMMWLWVFYRAKHDGPALLGWRHPWDDHGHGHSSGHENAHEKAHAPSKVKHKSAREKDGASRLADQPKPREALDHVHKSSHQVGDLRPKLKESNDKRSTQAVDLQPELRLDAVEPRPKLKEELHKGHRSDQESVHVKPNLRENVHDAQKSGKRAVDLHHKSSNILDEQYKSGQEEVDLQQKTRESSRHVHKSVEEAEDLQPKLRKKPDQQRKSGQEALDVFKDKRKIEKHAKVISLIENQRELSTSSWPSFIGAIWMLVGLWLHFWNKVPPLKGSHIHACLFPRLPNIIALESWLPGKSSTYRFCSLSWFVVGLAVAGGQLMSLHAGSVLVG